MTIIDRIYNREIKRRRYIIDICLKPSELPGRAKYTRTEKWTDKSAADLHAEGYRKAIGFKDSLTWWGIPVFVKITNGHEIDTASVPISQDTAFTLNDSMVSSATSDFIKGMARGAMQSMDVQKMIMIAIVGIGAIFGLKMLGVF